MDSKLEEALNRGREYMLGKFACLSDDLARPSPINEFIQQFGPLYPGLDLEGHVRYIWLFRGAWKVKSPEDKQAASEFIADVFNRRGTTPKIADPSHPNYRPLLEVDFSSGRYSIKPVTLLDWLAKWLLECRKNLAICERKGCPHRFFVKTHSRYRYCSVDCSEQCARDRKGRWARKSRAENKTAAKSRKKTESRKGR